MCVKDHGTHVSPAGHNENCRLNVILTSTFLGLFYHFIDGVEEDTGNNRDIKGHICLRCHLAIHPSMFISARLHLHYKGFTGQTFCTEFFLGLDLTLKPQYMGQVTVVI